MEKVSATTAALETIDRLQRRHGPLAFFQSGGCCDGSLPICLPVGELPAGPNDIELGDVGGARFYVDEDQYRRWNEPEFLLDVSDGKPEGFSLGGSEGVHFITRSPGAGVSSG